MTEKLTLNDVLAADSRDPGCEAEPGLIARYVEFELAGEDAAANLPRFAAHLCSCPDRRTDHDGILEAARILP